MKLEQSLFPAQVILDKTYSRDRLYWTKSIPGIGYVGQNLFPAKYQCGTIWAVRNHCRTHPTPCVRPRCVCSVLRAHAQFCRFDKADVTADVQWHCNHRPPLWYNYFPAQSSLGADILVYWIGKIVWTCAAGGSRTLDFLRSRRAPYPLGQALHLLTLRQRVDCLYFFSRLRFNDFSRVTAPRESAMAAHDK